LKKGKCSFRPAALQSCNTSILKDEFGDHTLTKTLVTVCGYFASETSLGLNTESLYCRSQGSEAIGTRPGTGPGGICYRATMGTGRIFPGANSELLQGGVLYW